MDDLRLAIGEDVQGAVEVAQADGAQRHLLDRAGKGLDLHDVAERDDVLDDQEEAGEEVLDQGLGAETDGDADHAGAGQDRRDLHADLAQQGHGGQDDDDDLDGAAENRPHRIELRRPPRIARARPQPGREILHEQRRRLQAQGGDDHDHGDLRSGRRDRAAPGGRRPAQQVEPPDFRDKEQSDQDDGGVQHPLGQAQRPGRMGLAFLAVQPRDNTQAVA